MGMFFSDANIKLQSSEFECTFNYHKFVCIGSYKTFLNLSVGLPLGLKMASLSLNSADELINLFKITLKTSILLS
jgi:hypothetical protein